uniref:Ig-like domain-containing protein n=1 Tax=Biomphalaria glabrata TaxID=6526 RepID=A0A2C9KMB7_BIOGL
MQMDKDNVTTYSAECYHILDSRMFENGIKFNINFTQDLKNGNTSVTSVSSASYYYESTKIVNFTVDENPIGVCANIADNVTLSCVTQGSPLVLKFLQVGPSMNNGYIMYDYPTKDMTWTMRSPSDYGYYMCFTGQQLENRKSKSVYVVSPGWLIPLQIDQCEHFC